MRCWSHVCAGSRETDAAARAHSYAIKCIKKSNVERDDIKVRACHHRALCVCV